MPRGALPVCDAFTRAAQECGIPCNPDSNDRAPASSQLTQRNVRRSSAATAFLRSAERRTSLTTLTVAAAIRIIVKVKGDRAVGVEAIRDLSICHS